MESNKFRFSQGIGEIHVLFFFEFLIHANLFFFARYVTQQGSVSIRSVVFEMFGGVLIRSTQRFFIQHDM